MSENAQDDGRWTVAWSTASSPDPRLRFAWDIADAPDTLGTKVVDGRTLVVAEPRGETVRVWDLATGDGRDEPASDFADVVRPGPSTFEFDGQVYTDKPVAPVTVDGRDLKVSCDGLLVRVCDAGTDQQFVEPFRVAPEVVTAVATAVVDGEHLVVATSGDDTHATLWAWELAPREKPGGRITAHAGEVADLATAVVDGRRVIVSCGDSTLRLWDPAAGELVGAPLTGHLDAVNGVATIVLDGRPHAVTTSMDATARLWDLTTGRQVGPCLSRYPAADLTAIPLAERLAVAFSGSTHHLFAVATAKVGDRGVAVVGGTDGAQVWDLATGEARGEPLTEDFVMQVVTADVDGRTIAVTAGGPSRVGLWDLATGASIGELPGEIATEGAVIALAAEEVDGRTVILTARVRLSGGTRIQIWDPVTRTLIAEIMEDPESRMLVGSLTVAVLDGRLCLIAGGIIPKGRGTLLVWDLATRELVGETRVFPSPVSAVIPYPGGREGPDGAGGTNGTDGTGQRDGSLAIGLGLDVAVLTPR
ncbi:WD40 repeat protein [Catenulispora sp. EB89]|uniref:WD40 repeat domain-containing protein n=1 Tax=Catenulispora sp. EB89 TaxID=3156257 RepID=UPI0035154C0B